MNQVMNQVMNQCIFIENEISSCTKLPKYGCYCWRHRKKFLLDENNELIVENFTHESKDYTFKEIKDHYIKHHLRTGEKKTKLTKEHCFTIISKQRDIMNHYSHPLNQKKIILLQKSFKEKQTKKYEKRRGPGYTNRKLCNNDEDFYTFDELDKIPNKFFFSYQDSNKHIWGFDIRSLKKLIDMHYDNPYTTEKIPSQIKKIMDEEIATLVIGNNDVLIQQEVVNDRKIIIKQRITDLFAQIEFCGYSCSIEWLLDLQIQKLRKLYRNLEDIWNYRANLPNEIKRVMAPPHGRVFVYPVQEINQYTNKLDILDVIVNEVFKFTLAQDISDQKLGFMYFLIGLGGVSGGCYTTHANWLNFI
jgi:hypothetical protein